jgi:hypothetical protein
MTTPADTLAAAIKQRHPDLPAKNVTEAAEYLASNWRWGSVSDSEARGLIIDLERAEPDRFTVKRVHVPSVEDIYQHLLAESDASPLYAESGTPPEEKLNLYRRCVAMSAEERSAVGAKVSAPKASSETKKPKSQEQAPKPKWAWSDAEILDHLASETGENVKGWLATRKLGHLRAFRHANPKPVESDAVTDLAWKASQGQAISPIDRLNAARAAAASGTKLPDHQSTAERALDGKPSQ